MKRQLPDLKFRIVGSHVTDKVKDLEKIKGVEVLGFVSDERLHELLSGESPCDCSAPLRRRGKG